MISYSGMKKCSVTCIIALAAFVAIALGDTQLPNFQSIAGNLPINNLNLDAINNLNLDAINSLNLDNLPSGFNASELPNLEDGERQLREKCVKNGGNVSYENFLRVKDETQVCLKGLVNITLLQEEIEANRYNGELDVVFKKYCLKAPILKGCVNNFTTAVEPCLEGSEKTLKNTVQSVIQSLLDFICQKDGDKIALFIAERGPECLKEHNEAIQSCLNTTANKYMPSDFGEDTVLPLLKLGQQECGDISSLQKCVVRELDQCEDPTPSNMVDSLITFVYKNSPCNKFKKA